MSGLRTVPGFDVPFRWIAATNSNDSNWPFKKSKFRVSAGLARRLRGPGIYRFVFFDEKDAIREIYIGESECILRRHRAYRMSNEPITVDFSNFDWDKHFKEQVKRKLMGAQHRVEFQILELDTFQLNSKTVDHQEFNDLFVRRLLENLTILDAEAQGIRLLNRGEDLRMKRFKKKIGRNRKPRIGRVNAA